MKFNIPQETKELNEVHATDYYWYLKSPEYREAFIKPLAEQVNILAGSCLDIACGEGYLAEYLDFDQVPHYVGFDGSEEAIRAAQAKNLSHAEFYVDRLEGPYEAGVLDKYYDTLVFGNVLHVLVGDNNHMQFVEKYLNRFNPSTFVVYELQRFDEQHLMEKYNRIYTFEASTNLFIGTPNQVKDHRKVSVYQCP